MKFSIVLILLAIVLIQQCMSTHGYHGGEKFDEDFETHLSHEQGDHKVTKGHKHEDCDHPDHKEKDHTDHKHGIIDHHGFRKHIDYIAHKFRLGIHAGFHQ
ncbi:uncharacterized protein LOC111031271 [Myzus persicae]|uniref:uncharacterized protein LOC111031271 n=1 Tax=Myzus persicae TaxID=13164 RepID=UPI000B92FCD9|nr:uncharacterized protein LOC111031271 [Myzus persicae]